MRIVIIDSLENRFKPEARKVEPVVKGNLKKYDKQQYKGKYLDVYV